MADTIFSEERYTSTVDSHQEHYMIERPAADVSGLLVFYLHSGLAHAGQGFCEDRDWCMADLRDEVLSRRGVYVSPNLRGDAWMNATVETDLLDMISQLKARFGSTKVVLAGASMGATSVLIFASHHPEMVNGIIALCPASDMPKLFKDAKSSKQRIYQHAAISMEKAYGGPPSKVPAEYAYRSSIEHVDALTMPIVIRHGEADEIVSVEHSINLSTRLRTQNTPIRCDIIPGGHSAPVRNAPWGEYLDFVIGAN